MPNLTEIEDSLYAVDLTVYLFVAIVIALYIAFSVSAFWSALQARALQSLSYIFTSWLLLALIISIAKKWNITNFFIPDFSVYGCACEVAVIIFLLLRPRISSNSSD